MPAPDIEGWGKHEFGRFVTYGHQVENAGANVDSYFTMPVPHRLLRMELKQTDTNDADTTDAFAYYLKRHITKSLSLALRSGNTTGQTVVELFGDGFESEGCQYNLITNTTNTNHTYAYLTFELLP